MISSRGAYFSSEHHSPAEIEVCDEADRRIIETEATTPRGALIQAWVAWSYIGTEHNKRDRRIGDLIRRPDFAALEREKAELDWEHVAMLQTVRSLRHLAGEA